MLVGGCFGLLKVLSLLWRQVRLRRYRDTGDVDADVDAVYSDDDDDDDEGGGAIMSKSSRYTHLRPRCPSPDIWRDDASVRKRPERRRYGSSNRLQFVAWVTLIAPGVCACVTASNAQNNATFNSASKYHQHIPGRVNLHLQLHWRNFREKSAQMDKILAQYTVDGSCIGHAGCKKLCDVYPLKHWEIIN